MAHQSSQEGDASPENVSPPAPEATGSAASATSANAHNEDVESKIENVAPAEDHPGDPNAIDDFETGRQQEEKRLRTLLAFGNVKREDYDQLSTDAQRDVYTHLMMALKGEADLIELASISRLEVMQFIFNRFPADMRSSEVLSQYLHHAAFIAEAANIEWLLQQGVRADVLHDDSVDEGLAKARSAWEVALANLNPDFPRSYQAAECFLLREIKDRIAPFDIWWNTSSPYPIRWPKHRIQPDHFWNSRLQSGWLTLAGNNLLWSIIIVYLRLTQRSTSINLAQVLECMLRDFKQLKQPAPYLYLREPVCEVDFLKDSNDADAVEDRAEPSHSSETNQSVTEEEDDADAEDDADEGDGTDGETSTAEEDATTEEIVEDEVENRVEELLGLPEPMSSEASYGSLSLPYFSSDIYDHLKARQGEAEAFAQSFKYCIGGRNTKYTSLHLQLTLDEYCRPVLGSRLDDINQKQVFARYDKLKSDANDEPTMLSNKVKRKASRTDIPGSTRLVTIRQAWLWKIDDIVVAAFADANEKYLREIYSEDIWQNGEGLSPDELLMMIGKFLSYLIDMLDNPLSEDAEPVLNVFEDSINLLSDMVNRYIKTSSIEDLKMEREINFLHDIGDIREELSMIKSVLQQQEDVWKDFISTAFPEHWTEDKFKPSPSERRDEWRIIARPQKQFERYKRRIAQLEEDADRVKDSISTRLDLQSKHVSMQEAHSNAVLSTAVFGFTIITIIFTPLSFVISLLALPVHKYQNHQENGAYSQGYVAWNMFAGEIVTLFVTIVAMWAAVEFLLLKNVKERWTPWLEKHFPALYKEKDRRVDEPKDKPDNKTKGSGDTKKATNEKTTKEPGRDRKTAKGAQNKNKAADPKSSDAVKEDTSSATPKGDDIV